LVNQINVNGSVRPVSKSKSIVRLHAVKAALTAAGWSLLPRVDVFADPTESKPVRAIQARMLRKLSYMESDIELLLDQIRARQSSARLPAVVTKRMVRMAARLLRLWKRSRPIARFVAKYSGLLAISVESAILATHAFRQTTALGRIALSPMQLREDHIHG
jgi:hypothetical protein